MRAGKGNTDVGGGVGHIGDLGPHTQSATDECWLRSKSRSGGVGTTECPLATPRSVLDEEELPDDDEEQAYLDWDMFNYPSNGLHASDMLRENFEKEAAGVGMTYR
ncbi:hypothetical protein BYT27DRAFT_7247790 [Phlegmacium glaucopus]|nr:hypothetical protein BYT27DRAFT_7247790 [Phlegmacium glaucopus]